MLSCGKEKGANEHYYIGVSQHTQGKAAALEDLGSHLRGRVSNYATRDMKQMNRALGKAIPFMANNFLTHPFQPLSTLNCSIASKCSFQHLYSCMYISYSLQLNQVLRKFSRH